MPETRVFLGLGSNVGARRKQLRAALAALAALPGARLGRCSSLYETEPWGLREQRAFLNCAAELHASAAPLELLEALQALELQAGRGPGPHGPHWGPRPLDVDILAMGGTEDSAVSATQLNDWRRLTSRDFSVRLLPGGHFFLFQGTGLSAVGSASSPRVDGSPALQLIVNRLERLIAGGAKPAS